MEYKKSKFTEKESRLVVSREAMVHIHNGILLSCKKEDIWVNSNEVGEPGAYYTEWSKSERETQILYINAYIWNL